MNPVLNVGSNGSDSRLSSPVGKGKAAPPSRLTNPLFPSLERPLANVEAMLQSELQSSIPYVDELLQYVGTLSGKRMRPSLLFLAADAAGEIVDDHVVLASVIEMIHIATLVHDDILDGADTRRHKVTVNQKYGNQSSVLLGDYLFTHSFYLASTLETTFACRRIGQATNRVCAGELHQVGNAGNLALAEDAYYEIIRGKTAELCACATALGAHYAGADEATCAALEEYGMQLGVAFQIADDLLDLTGDEAKTGKSQGTDVEKQKLTLPVIHLLREGPKSAVDEAMSILASADGSPESLARLRGLMEASGSLEYARNAAITAADLAAAQLDCLPESEAKATLQGLTRFVVARTH